MSAFGGKADITGARRICLLLTQSGHSSLVLIGSVCHGAEVQSGATEGPNALTRLTPNASALGIAHRLACSALGKKGGDDEPILRPDRIAIDPGRVDRQDILGDLLGLVQDRCSAILPEHHNVEFVRLIMSRNAKGTRP